MTPAFSSEVFAFPVTHETVHVCLNALRCFYCAIFAYHECDCARAGMGSSQEGVRRRSSPSYDCRPRVMNTKLDSGVPLPPVQWHY